MAREGRLSLEAAGRIARGLEAKAGDHEPAHHCINPSVAAGADDAAILGSTVRVGGAPGPRQDVLASGAFLSMIVPLVVFFAFQRYFVQGLLAGSVGALGLLAPAPGLLNVSYDPTREFYQEFNEAFAVQAVAIIKELDLDAGIQEGELAQPARERAHRSIARPDRAPRTRTVHCRRRDAEELYGY